MTVPENIYLIGMMGSWKTTVGKKLASALKIPFSDTDHELERRLRMTVREVFEELGEKFFRREETRTLRELSKSGGKVISTGGGIILTEENRKTLRNTGYTILLKAAPLTLSARIGNTKKRPLIGEKQSVHHTIHQLWEERRNHYISTARFIIETDKLNSNETAEILLDHLRNRYA